MESDQISTSASEPTPDNVEVAVVKKDTMDQNSIEQESKPLQSLNFIYLNLSEAQKQKGKFTLNDARAVLVSYRLLKSFLEARITWENKNSSQSETISSDKKDKEESVSGSIIQDETKEPRADDSMIKAVQVLISGTEVMQATGIFSMDGADQLLAALQILDGYVSENKTLELRAAEKRKEKKEKRKGKK